MSSNSFHARRNIMEELNLPKHYEFSKIEGKIQKFWEENRIYRFDPDSDKPVFSVDTPPPTVSGSLHIGHIFSYTQAEAIVRYFRMKGYNILYPMGFDDNGLPSERLTEKENNIKGIDMPRDKFIDICLKTTEKYIREFAHLWKRLGFSIEWDRTYSTIDERSRRISQRSFIQLYNAGKIYKKASPALFCTDCMTSFAQAEIENIDRPSVFYDIVFKDETGKDHIISTTRPELLPACVAVFIHPDDSRYKGLAGRSLKVPIFDSWVKVISDHRVDMEKGTGLVMCCTFGDKTDIEWWQHYKLPLKEAIAFNGHMTSIAGKYAGMHLKKARKIIVQDLKESDLVTASRDIVHPVGTHERCGTDVEFLTIPQWFVRVLDAKETLVKFCNDVEWYPDYMKYRFINWVENLEWDWCISRQRFFGVPFPLWYCSKCSHVILADEDSLPVDPLSSEPARPCPACGCGQFIPEKDVMDTWATSSMTPMIVSQWMEKDDLSSRVFPLTLRPQAHEIIRTWAFYSMVKSVYHFNSVPWKKAMISGFVVAEKKSREKISKSKGNAPSSPEELLDQYGADILRYWSCSAKLGSDYTFNEQDLKSARKLLTKIYNASKFCLGHLGDYTKSDINLSSHDTIDRWILSRLSQTIKKADEYLKEFEFGIAKNEIERFFWNSFCDNYIEIVKDRLYHPEIHGQEKRTAGQNALYHSLFAVLRLFAPFLPHITEEIYQIWFRRFENMESIHLQSFPDYRLFPSDADSFSLGENTVHSISLIRRYRTENKMSIKDPIRLITLVCKNNIIKPDLIRDIKYSANIGSVDILIDENMEEPAAIKNIEI